MRHRMLFVFTMLLAVLPSGAQPSAASVVKIEAERLPDLNIPRFGHAVYCINGELTVIGGHTSGFKPITTAEYLSDGEWHQVPTVYPHDFGVSLVLKSGQVLFAGGCKDNLGSGQTFEAEMYDPASHTFNGFGCLAQKRTLGSAIELDSGQVMITGNWYADDCIEMFNGKKFFTKIKDVSTNRVAPHLFRTSDDDVLILSDKDNHGNAPDSIIIDRLYGKPFTVPLLKQWRPMTSFYVGHHHSCFIGDESHGKYAYLMMVSDFVLRAPDAERQGKTPGQIAVMLVEDTVFSLLPTTTPIPMTTDIAGPIYYNPTIVADSQSQYAYLYGYDKDKRLYIVRIEYAKRPAPLTLYYTDPLPDCGIGVPVMTDDGNIAFIGGCEQENFVSDYFHPVASAWLIRFNGQSTMASSAMLWWIWPIAAVLAVLVVAGCALFIFRRRKAEAVTDSQPVATATAVNGELMQQIDRLMTEQHYFLRSNLKVADIATVLNTNNRYVSDSIKQYHDCSFSDFIARLRINYAQQLMQNEPDKKVAAIAIESGFSSESSFFRAFKSITGMTPTEWRNQ